MKHWHIRICVYLVAVVICLPLGAYLTHAITYASVMDKYKSVWNNIVGHTAPIETGLQIETSNAEVILGTNEEMTTYSLLSITPGEGMSVAETFEENNGQAFQYDTGRGTGMIKYGSVYPVHFLFNCENGKTCSYDIKDRAHFPNESIKCDCQDDVYLIKIEKVEHGKSLRDFQYQDDGINDYRQH